MYNYLKYALWNVQVSHTCVAGMCDVMCTCVEHKQLNSIPSPEAEQPILSESSIALAPLPAHPHISFSFCSFPSDSQAIDWLLDSSTQTKEATKEVEPLPLCPLNQCN